MLAAQSPPSWAVTGAAAAKDRDVRKKMERDMKKLEYLSLVSKVSTELLSHMGVADRVLAEFVIDLGRTSRSVGDFDARLKANGADIADCLVRTLFTVIHATLHNDHRVVRKVDERRDDLLPMKRRSSNQNDDASTRRCGEEEEEDHAPCRRPSMSSLEKLEAKQLIASSVLGAGINEHHRHTEEDGEEEEEGVEVELNEDDAPEFLLRILQRVIAQQSAK